MRGDTVLIRSGDSDAVARRLLNQTPARDLEITARGLEEAFIPLSQFSPDLQTFAKFTPLYGLSQLVHYPLIGGTLELGLGPEPGRLARHLRDRRRLVPAPRHRESLIQRRSRPRPPRAGSARDS